MIYVSSASIKEKNLNTLLNIFKKNKINNIELSGGVKFEKNISNIISKNNKKMNFLIHNYFPPPKKNFILNLGSTNENIRLQSVNLCKKAINLCKKFGIKKYAVHAPFLIDFTPNEAGKLIKKRKLSNKKIVLKKFKKSWLEINKTANKKVNLYIEKNVLNNENFKNYSYKNPFLLTDYKSYLFLKKKINFNLLLDFGHLYVSSKTLKKNFAKECSRLTKLTNYFHISNNNGKKDQNNGLNIKGEIFKILKKNINYKNSTFTLEVYKDIKTIKKNIKLIESLKNS